MQDATKRKKDVIKLLETRKARFADVQYDIQPPTAKELKLVIRRMKRGKVPCPDDITTEFLKDLDEDNLAALADLIAEWWNTGDIPNEILNARVASLYKKGDPDVQVNYRPISLLNSFYKLVAACLQRRLADAVDQK